MLSTSEVRFGIGCFDGYPINLQLALTSERLGFDSIWMYDHIAALNYSNPEALITLTQIASKTEKMQVGTSVIDLYRRHPVTLAQMVSTLDVISGGRVLLGVGAGGGPRNNLAAYGVPAKKPFSRMEECIKILKMFWTEAVVNFAGSFYKFKDASLRLKPVQKPHPPVLVGAHGPRGLKIAGELGDGWVPNKLTPELYSTNLDIIKRWWGKMKRGSFEFLPAYLAFTSISRSRAIARKYIDHIARSLLIYGSVGPLRLHERLGYKEPWTNPQDVPTDVIDQCLIFGTPQDCVKKIERYIKAGVKHFIFSIKCPERELLSSLNLYSKVISHFKE
jgi:alkanesulfonate monooxygenase SsuD/methylene tetrahydromethanopterin reductase-like flavin-dependent oxidoreductase (luciferase family)